MQKTGAKPHVLSICISSIQWKSRWMNNNNIIIFMKRKKKDKNVNGNELNMMSCTSFSSTNASERNHNKCAVGLHIIFLLS